MALLDVAPMLRTKDLARSAEFYTKILGFTCTGLDPRWGWASLQWDGVRIVLATPNVHEPFTKPNFTGSLYFCVNNADALWEKFKGTVKVCYPLEDFIYGMREFGIYDNNGYLLQFGQDISENGKESVVA